MSAAGHAQYDITFARKTYHRDILPNQYQKLLAKVSRKLRCCCAKERKKVALICNESLAGAKLQRMTQMKYLIISKSFKSRVWGAGKQGNDDKEMRAAGRLKNAHPPDNPQFR